MQQLDSDKSADQKRAAAQADDSLPPLNDAGIDPSKLDPADFTLIDAPEDKDYFNSPEYNTVVVGVEKEEEEPASTAKESPLAPSTLGLSAQAIEALKKQPDAAALLLKAIHQATDNALKLKLLTACWESGIDCRAYLNSFIQIAVEGNFDCTLEVFSIVDGMDFPIEKAQVQLAQEALAKGIAKEKDELKKGMLLQINELLNPFLETE